MEEQIKNIILEQWPFATSRASKRIAEHFMEFIEWLNFGDNDFYPNAVKDETGYYREGSQRVWSIEEVYQYWLSNIKSSK